MTRVYHAHLYGKRDSKYDWLLGHDISSTDWSDLEPKSPFYLLIPQNIDLLDEYNKGWRIIDSMPVNSVGIVTARDKLTIHWSKDEIWNTVQDFESLDIASAREKYSLGKDTRDWKIAYAQADLKKTGPSQKNLVPILYRPFDIRYTYYTGHSKGFHCMPRGEIMGHIVNKKNLCLAFMRQVAVQEEYSHFIVTENIVDNRAFYSNKGIMQVAPLYLYPDNTEISQNYRSNFSPKFIDALTNRLNVTPTPEDIFYYIYAVLHSPTYRQRYSEFLKIDFPRVPLTRNLNLFRLLVDYGKTLTNIHLMRSPSPKQFGTKFQERSNRVIAPAHPKYNDGKVTINKQGDGFSGVPEEVWNFYVGGYQVCHKWLKDRKGRTLSDDDIRHYQRIVVALKETITLMQKIDEAIPSWPIE